MSLDGNQAWIHKAREKAEAPTDRRAIEMVQALLRDHFGLHGLTGEALFIPQGNAEARLPDLFIKARVPQIAVELDGGYHGLGDPFSKIKHDVERDFDYSLLWPGTQLIVANKAQTGNYDEIKLIKLFELSGLKHLTNCIACGS